MRPLLVIAFCAFSAAVFAQPTTKTIIVSSDDGYGTTTCLANGDECGRIVADAMCNSEGFPRAHRFGEARAGETTATVVAQTPKSNAFFVECGP
jgi:hypothetical protein